MGFGGLSVIGFLSLRASGIVRLCENINPPPLPPFVQILGLGLGLGARGEGERGLAWKKGGGDLECLQRAFWRTLSLQVSGLRACCPQSEVSSACSGLASCSKLRALKWLDCTHYNAF